MVQIKATTTQRIMLALMGAVLLLLLPWLWFEISGILDIATQEDTYSEWFFDLPWALLIPLSLLHLVAGVLLVWASIHFIEGKIRRLIERRTRDNG